MQMNSKVCTMILHEPRVDEYFLPFSVVLSTNLVVLFTKQRELYTFYWVLRVDEYFLLFSVVLSANLVVVLY